MAFKTELNDKQLEAVTATEGPVLVLAGAGSGKTRVLTERIAYLISEKCVSPYNVLAFTFTNKAAQEMRNRLERSIPASLDALWVGTFHATGVRILRRHGDRINIPLRFSIYDADDSLSLIKSILSRLGLEGGVLRSANAIKETISRWKRDLITPELAHEHAVSNIDHKIVQIYNDYEKDLRRANALDFDDLIAKVVELFSVHPEIKDLYAKRFEYVLVDEFQDTNPIQMLMIDALSSYKLNLFVVGDDDQSIYGWRGARVEHMLNFENLYPGTRLIRLEQNYRSTQTILEAANYVIANNRGRKGKNLWTEGEVGEKIRLMATMDEEAEAMSVLETVHSLREKDVTLRNIAILYRTNAQSRALEEVLKLANLPYQIIGSVRFYERMEVRDLLAYCKLIANSADSVSLKRIINVPRRALGKTTVQALESQALTKGVPVLELIGSGDFDVGSGQRKRCVGFHGMIKKLQQIAERKSAPEVIEAVIKEIDYETYLKEGYPDSDSRIENIEELVAAAHAYAENHDDKSLSAFLEEIALVSDIDKLDETLGVLTLMTLHNAKGLEYEVIIITGLEDNLFPHYSSHNDPSELEEERRLLYVGMTRAKKQLYLTYANMRRRMGYLGGQAPSRFLHEIPEQFCEGTIGDGLVERVDSIFGSGSRTDAGQDGYAQSQPEYEDYSQEEVVYRVGMRIHHRNFGRGVVRRVEGRGEDMRVVVLFDGGGERKFIAKYAPMRPM